ncbi:MAG: hypothetical protein WD469_02895 [Paenibacillaceae bacterium]
MINHGYRLKTEADFHNAIIFGLIVSITQGGEHYGSGPILSQSYHVVQMIDSYFFKHTCEFTVCSTTAQVNHHKT